MQLAKLHFGAFGLDRQVAFLGGAVEAVIRSDHWLDETLGFAARE